MKIFELLLFIFYKVFILFAGVLFISGIGIFAVLNNWLFILIFIPLFLYYYGSSMRHYKEKKHVFAKEKRLRR